MAWGDTGGGYTWQGNIGGKDRYSKIVPANREARIDRLARQGNNLGGGRSLTDAPNWAAAHPTRSFGFDRAGAARGDLEDYGRNYRNIELANRRGLGSLDRDQGMGLFGHIKGALGIGQDEEERTGGGFNIPFPSGIGYAGMMADSIVKNQAQHKDLDQYFQSTYGDDWRNAKNASFFNQQGFRPGLDWRSLSNRNNPDRDVSGLSQAGKQAMNYFNRAGVTDQAMAKFMDPTYKFGGNEAWLRAQADGDKMDLFDDGMRQIKNARDTSDLHGRMTRGPIQDASERSMELGIGIEGRPDWDTFDEDITSAIQYGDPNPEGDILYGEPTGTDERVARGLSYPEPDMFDTLYGEPTPDPFGGMYESPLTDDFYNEQLIDKTPERPLHSKHIFRPRDTIYPLMNEEDEITPNYLDPNWLLSQ